MNLVRRVANLEATLPVQFVPPEPVPFEKPSDVVHVVAECVNAVRADPLLDPAEKARTLGFLSAVGLRAMAQKDMAARLEAVERVLKLRRTEQDEAALAKKRRKW